MLLISSAVSPYQYSTTMPSYIHALWSSINKYAGYRYAITSATAPATTTPGSAVPVQVQWTNFGTAPTYDKWQITYEIRNASNTVVGSVASPLALTSLAAAQNYTNLTAAPASQSVVDNVSLSTQGLGAGYYTVVAKVAWNDHKSGATHTVNMAPMNLAQAGRDSSGAYRSPASASNRPPLQKRQSRGDGHPISK